ncbi:hypothetical protein [Streptomyces sp. NPDC059076]
MSRKANYSVTALSRAAGGEQLPSLAVVLAYGQTSTAAAPSIAVLRMP